MGRIGFVFAYVGGAIAISIAWPRRAKSVLLLGALICIGFALAPRDFGDFHFNWESAFAVSLIFALFGNILARHTDWRLVWCEAGPCPQLRLLHLSFCFGSLRKTADARRLSAAMLTLRKSFQILDAPEWLICSADAPTANVGY